MPSYSPSFQEQKPLRGMAISIKESATMNSESASLSSCALSLSHTHAALLGNVLELTALEGKSSTVLRHALLCLVTTMCFPIGFSLCQ